MLDRCHLNTYYFSHLIIIYNILTGQGSSGNQNALTSSQPYNETVFQAPGFIDFLLFQQWMLNTSNHKTRNNISLIAQQPGKKTDCSMHETSHTFSPTEKTTYTLQKEPSILNPQLRSHIFTKRSKTFFKFGYSILLYFWPMR